MKKFLAIILSVVMVFAMAACGSDDSGASTDGDSAGYPTMELTLAALDKEDTAKAHDLKIFMDLVKIRWSYHIQGLLECILRCCNFQP